MCRTKHVSFTIKTVEIEQLLKMSTYDIDHKMYHKIMSVRILCSMYHHWRNIPDDTKHWKLCKSTKRYILI